MCADGAAPPGSPARSAPRSTHVAAIAVTALVLVPGAWTAAVSGTRFSLGLAAALLLVPAGLAPLALVRPARQAGWRLCLGLAVLVLAKVGVGLADTPEGWRGTYTMLTPAPALTAQFAWRLGVHPFRIDEQPGLGGTAPSLQFLNDFHRYNGRQYAPPRATSQALRVTWTGWFERAAGAALEIHGQVRGTASVWVDDRQVATAGDGAPVAGRAVDVTPGPHRVTVIYDKPAGLPPGCYVQVLVDGRPPGVRPSPATPIANPRLLAGVSDALTIAGLLWWLLHMARLTLDSPVRGSASGGGAVLTLVTTVGLLGGSLVTAAPFVNYTYELRPGDDHLAYEGLARNVLIEGVLMPEGQAPGRGRPFYFYPLYSYALAGAHLALGDDYAAVVLLNAAAAAVLPLLFWHLGWRRLRVGVQALGLAALAAFVWRHDAVYFESPLTDNLFIPLVFVTLLITKRLLTSFRWRDGLLTGASIAAGATTRPSFFLFIAPAVLLVLWLGRDRRLATRLTAATAVLAGYALALAPVVLRNWIMSGQAVAMVTLSHAIPISLVPPEALDASLLEHPALRTWASSLALAWSIIVANPLGVAWLEVRKILFTLGLTNLGPGASRLIVEFPVLCVAALTALGRRRVAATTAVVLAAFVLSHLAAIVLAYPWTYGYKTILPVQLVFLFCALHLFPGPREGAVDAG